MDQDQPDHQMEEREAEKTADLESLADALAAFRQLHRDLDQRERVHLSRGFATVLSACYGGRYHRGGRSAALALTPEIERSPQTRLPTDPLYERLDLDIFKRALDGSWAEPARRFPRFGPVDGL